MIFHACSRKNGITFYSTKLPIIGVETRYDENGHIQSETIFAKPSEFIHSLELLKDFKHFSVSLSSTIIFILVILILSFLAYEYSQNFGFAIAGINFCCLGAYDFLKLLKTNIYNKKSSFNNLSVAKFHGAEHMAVQAYNTLNKVPTLEEIKNFSRFDKYCGSQKTLSHLFLTFIGSISFILLVHIGLHYSILTLIITSIIFIVTFTLLTIFNKTLTFLQIFTTSKPTDKELYLAIEGIRQFVLLEEQLEDTELVESLKELSDSLNKIVDKESEEIFGK